jgi:hypothetical protein
MNFQELPGDVKALIFRNTECDDSFRFVLLSSFPFSMLNPHGLNRTRPSRSLLAPWQERPATFCGRVRSHP